MRSLICLCPCWECDRIIDRVEQQDVEQAEALIQLAQLRTVDLKVLMSDRTPEFIAARSYARKY